jgi:hypothetical protein
MFSAPTTISRVIRISIYGTSIPEILQFIKKARESQGFFAALDFPGPLLYTVAVKSPARDAAESRRRLQQAVQRMRKPTSRRP